jgi:hypothetical protein
MKETIDARNVEICRITKEEGFVMYSDEQIEAALERIKDLKSLADQAADELASK